VLHEYFINIIQQKKTHYQLTAVAKMCKDVPFTSVLDVRLLNSLPKSVESNTQLSILHIIKKLILNINGKTLVVSDT